MTLADRSRWATGRRWGLLAALALHGLLLWSWLQQSKVLQVASPAAPAGPVISWVRPAPAPPTKPANSAVQTAPVVTLPASRKPPQWGAPPSHTPNLATELPIQATLAPAEPPASAPETPTQSLAGRLVNGTATRQALRQSAQQPLLAEAAGQATHQAIQRTDAGLQQGVAQSAHGDCLKGDVAGGGMGLLSLPFLAYAAAAGKCAR